MPKFQITSGLPLTDIGRHGDLVNVDDETAEYLLRENLGILVSDDVIEAPPAPPAGDENPPEGEPEAPAPKK